MVPVTVVGVTTLILVVSPGIVFELIRQRNRPGRDESVFLEISRVLLGGVLLTGVSLALIGAVRAITPGGVADPRRLLVEPLYIPNHLWLVGLSIALFFAVSTTLAHIAFLLLPFPGLRGQVVVESAWITVFARLLGQLSRHEGLDQRGFVTQVQVTLLSGASYVGTRSSFSADLPLENRELVLSPPLFQVGEEGRLVPLEAGWTRLILAGPQIDSILVRFGKTAGASRSLESGGSGRRRLGSDLLVRYRGRFLAGALVLELALFALLGQLT